jgi:hypothetical protein
MFVYNLIIGNTDMCHQQMCMMSTQISHWIQISQSNIEILKDNQE